MPTIRLVPSAYTRSSTSRVTVTNPDYMYDNTDDTTDYATLRGRNSSSSTYYCFIHGFDFTQIPSNAVVSAFSIKIRCYRSSNQRTGSSYDLRLASSPSSGSVISNTTASTAIGTSASVITIPTGNLTWDTLKSYGTNFSIDVVLASNSNQYPYVYVYGAEIEVTYSAETVHVTGVSVSPTTASIAQSETVTLAETVVPSNATDKSVTWSSSNNSIATVDSNGVVTGVSPGTATITVTTTDGSYTATCAVTVTAAEFVDFELATALEAGEEYIIASGNSGNVYLISTDAPSAQHLAGVAATVSNNRISITTGQAAKTVFTAELEDANNPDSTLLKNGSQYLYTDSSSRLRMYTWTSSAAGKHWHYKADGKNLLWFFKDGTNNTGYTDTSSTYKYYLTITNGVFADAYVSTTSLENTTTPAIYLFKKVQSSAPVITVGTPSRAIISDESGYDQATCTFRSDMALQAWEARATKAGTTPARGVGLLVESGTTLAANTDATVVVDDEELTNGDGEYTITVYGQSTGGVWSE